MSLPTILHPTFLINVYSKEKEYKFRPFLIQEEKILLIANESDSELDKINAIKQIISNCCVEDLDVEDLATFDLEYIFLKLRARSVNNISEMAFKDLEDEKTYNFKVDLDKIELTINPEHTNKVKVTDDITIVLKYPKISLMNDFNENTTATEVSNSLLLHSVDKIYDNETVYEDYTMEELSQFIESLPITASEQFNRFFDTMPKLYHKLEYVNEKGNERSIELTSLQDFFNF